MRLGQVTPVVIAVFALALHSLSSFAALAALHSFVLLATLFA
jgi:hypothetical protein